jgi:HNH endonuclease
MQAGQRGVACSSRLHESEWFRQNSMSVYNTDLTLDPDNLLNDLSNVVLLRPDLHIALDDRKFVFYPKKAGKFVVHMLEPSPDLTQLYHNVQVQQQLQCHPSFLYTRFAWAIFVSLAGFLSNPGVSRYLLLSKETSKGRELVAEEVARPEEVRAKISASRGRSPKKRQKAKESDFHEQKDEDRSSCCRRKRRRRASVYSSTSEVTTNWVEEPGTPETQVSEEPLTCSEHLAKVELQQDMELLEYRLGPNTIEHLPAWCCE